MVKACTVVNLSKQETMLLEIQQDSIAGIKILNQQRNVLEAILTTLM